MNETQKFFKPKINWKFIQYLEYKLTKYEDAGHLVNIKVMLNGSNVYVIYNDASKSYNKLNDIDKAKSDYNKNGLFYYLSIYVNGKSNESGVIQDIIRDISENTSEIKKIATGILFKPLNDDSIRNADKKIKDLDSRIASTKSKLELLEMQRKALMKSIKPND